jgi:DNA-binding PadR family transcriptional regulator
MCIIGEQPAPAPSEEGQAETPRPRLLYTLTDVGREQLAKLVSDEAPHTGPEEPTAQQ